MNKKKQLRRPRTLKAFTLLEMIVVMAIIGILASIIVPSTVDQIRTSRIESANTRAEEIYRAVQNYCTDRQIKRAPLVQKTGSTDTPAFPLTAATKNKVGITFTVNSATSWEIKPYGASALSDATVMQKCVKGISNYLGTTTMESLVGTAFFVYFDTDTYTVDYVLYCDQDDKSTTAVNESATFVNGVASGGAMYTQVFGKPPSGGKSQEYDTNQYLEGKSTATNVAPYVGQYPI